MDELKHLMEGLPLVGGMVGRSSSSSGGTINVREVLVPIVVGLVSAVGSSQLTSVRLEERFIAAERSNVEFREEMRREMTAMKLIDSDLRDRMARAESLIAPQAGFHPEDRRPR